MSLRCSSLIICLTKNSAGANPASSIQVFSFSKFSNALHSLLPLAVPSTWQFSTSILSLGASVCPSVV